MRRLAWVSFLAVSFTHGMSAYAVPLSEQHAWCVDKSSSYSNYAMQKSYNECMKTAVRQIRDYEEKQRQREIEWEKGAPERERRRLESLKREREERELMEAEWARKAREAKQRRLKEQRKIQEEKQQEVDFWNTFSE